MTKTIFLPPHTIAVWSVLLCLALPGMSLADQVETIPESSQQSPSAGGGSSTDPLTSVFQKIRGLMGLDDEKPVVAVEQTPAEPTPEITQPEQPAVAVTAEKAVIEVTAADAEEQSRTAAEKAALEKLATEKAELERLTSEKAQQIRLAEEKLAAEKAERQRMAAEKVERDRIAQEKAEEELKAREQAELNRQAAEMAEQKRIAEEKAAEVQKALEQAELARQATEKAELKRIAEEKAAEAQKALEQAESARQATEKAELKRIAEEKAIQEKTAAARDEQNRAVASKVAAEPGKLENGVVTEHTVQIKPEPLPAIIASVPANVPATASAPATASVPAAQQTTVTVTRPSSSSWQSVLSLVGLHDDRQSIPPMELKNSPSLLGQDYIIGPGDVIGISVWRDESLTRSAVVLPDGKIQFPLIGEIVAGGRTVLQLKQEFVEKLSKYVVDADISVDVKQSNSLVIYIIGKVNSPGRQMLVSNTTVLQALSMAGGLNLFADKDDIKIFRQDNDRTVVYSFRYSKVVSGTYLDDNIMLKRGDVIVVP